ncbi:MAG: hypothetical protein V3V15_01790 [Sphingorhabdus sp.]
MHSITKTLLTAAAALTLPFGLAACSSEPDNSEAVAQLDKKLAGRDADPAMNSALNDRILVDPDLTDSANVTAVKPADAPLNGQTPPDNGYRGDTPGKGRGNGKRAIVSAEELNNAKLMRAPKPTVVAAQDCKSCGSKRATTLGGLANDQGMQRGKGTCDAKLRYGAKWATRMPTEFPVYPKGRVKEAAGIDGGKCDIRVASFTTSAKMQNVVDYYYTRAKRSGYSAEYQLRAGEHALGGVRKNDGGAFFITFNRHPGGGTTVDIVANNGR